MKHAKPLPGNLVQRHLDQRNAMTAETRSRLSRLAKEGQEPQALVIACCDSRVLSTSLFGAEHGDFFIHRSIANLVPPYAPDGAHHGTSAAIEFSVNVLKVPHVIVLGHSQCGGVQGCADMCAGRAPELEKRTSFVGGWMDILRVAYPKVAHLEGREQTLALEREAVLVSLENLMTFPFVREKVEAGQLELHGLWTDIGEGDLWVYSADSDTFERL